MFFMFMPFEEHFDRGFGATGDAFKMAADALEKQSVGSPTDFWNHLPVSYLRRHACELYLKSAIVILHRWLRLAYGEIHHDGEPHIKIKKDWQPISRVHSIGTLYAYWRPLSDACLDVLTSDTGKDWSVPSEIGDWVTTIDKSDAGSTLFRYPMTKKVEYDRAKSPYVPIKDTELMPDETGHSASGFLFIDTGSNTRLAYRSDDSAVEDISEALKGLSDFLFRRHARMRNDLTGGL